ncbi:MAG: threonine/serine dehydratase [Myxococcota bacterium]|nr:threonine/serine dehydratase [Myxococcota bacterium]
MSEVDLARFARAHERIAPHIVETPCWESPLLCHELGAQVFLKLENQQVTGSFKVRGVVNKCLSLRNSDQQKPLIAASTGNHGAAFAHALRRFDLKGMLFVPENIDPHKRRALVNTGVQLVFFGTDCVQTEHEALHRARETHGIYISPYNDWDIIRGQGTIGIEIMAQLGAVDVVFVPVGGGGLISGIAAYLKAVSPKTRIIGCQPAASPVMASSIEAGHIVEMESFPTLSDATAGGIESGAVTFDLCRQFVDGFVIATEEEIQTALEQLATQLHLAVEGAAALALAAAKKSKPEIQGKRVALIISGSGGKSSS